MKLGACSQRNPIGLALSAIRSVSEIISVLAVSVWIFR